MSRSMFCSRICWSLPQNTAPPRSRRSGPSPPQCPTARLAPAPLPDCRREPRVRPPAAPCPTCRADAVDRGDVDERRTRPRRVPRWPSTRYPTRVAAGRRLRLRPQHHRRPGMRQPSSSRPAAADTSTGRTRAGLPRRRRIFRFTSVAPPPSPPGECHARQPRADLHRLDAQHRPAGEVVRRSTHDAIAFSVKVLLIAGRMLSVPFHLRPDRRGRGDHQLPARRVDLIGHKRHRVQFPRTNTLLNSALPSLAICQPVRPDTNPGAPLSRFDPP